MNEILETIKVVGFCMVLVCAVQGATLYAVVKLLTTNKAALFERKPRLFTGTD